MVGTRSFALRLGIPSSHALMVKKTVTNLDVLMSFTHTRCGALATSEECTLHGKEELILKMKFMIKQPSIKLIPIEHTSAPDIGFNHDYDALKLIHFYLNIQYLIFHF